MTSFLDVHRWRRMGWPRIVMYIFSFLLAVHLFRTFSGPTTTTTTPLEVVRDFPWYQQGHIRLNELQGTKYTTTNLSTKERQKLTSDMVIKATQAAQEQFASIRGIPGSVFHGNEETQAFRSLVDCWTRGKWVPVPFLKYVMPHFQDPLYGSCDRKFAKQNTSGQRDAVKYVWKSECDSNVEMDGENWCKVLRGRHLLLVGDLVHYQLHELFLDTLRDGPAVCFGELNCKGKFVIVSIISLSIYTT
jgi:hypothetical protein